jgi:hypothetical protein
MNKTVKAGGKHTYTQRAPCIAQFRETLEMATR